MHDERNIKFYFFNKPPMKIRHQGVATIPRAPHCTPQSQCTKFINVVMVRVMGLHLFAGRETIDDEND